MAWRRKGLISKKLWMTSFDVFFSRSNCCTEHRDPPVWAHWYTALVNIKMKWMTVIVFLQYKFSFTDRGIFLKTMHTFSVKSTKVFMISNSQNHTMEGSS